MRVIFYVSLSKTLKKKGKIYSSDVSISLKFKDSYKQTLYQPITTIQLKSILNLQKMSDYKDYSIYLRVEILLLISKVNYKIN